MYWKLLLVICTTNLPVSLVSKLPMADTKLDTISGRMRHFSMFRKSSPGKLTYVISLLVHVLELLNPKPRAIPAKTPAKVATVMRFSPRHWRTGWRLFLGSFGGFSVAMKVLDRGWWSPLPLFGGWSVKSLPLLGGVWTGLELPLSLGESMMMGVSGDS